MFVRSPFAAFTRLSMSAICAGVRLGFARSFSISVTFFFASSALHCIILSAASAPMGLSPAACIACSNAVRASPALFASKSATPW